MCFNSCSLWGRGHFSKRKIVAERKIVAKIQLHLLNHRKTVVYANKFLMSHRRVQVLRVLGILASIILQSMIFASFGIFFFLRKKRQFIPEHIQVSTFIVKPKYKWISCSLIALVKGRLQLPSSNLREFESLLSSFSKVLMERPQTPSFPLISFVHSCRASHT